MLNTPPENPASAKPRRAASSSGRPAASVNENARPRASTHWMRSGAGGPGCSMLRIASATRLGDIVIGRVFVTRTASHFARKRFGLKQPSRLEFIADQPLRNLAVAGFRQRLPEEETLRHLVARHLRREKRGEFRFAHRSRTLARDADGNADLAPERVGHAEHRHLADRGMGENLLLDLAGIDVGAARDVHVGGAAGDVDKPLLVHMAEIAGTKPAVTKRLRVGLGVVVIAGKHGGTDHTDLAGLERFQLAPVVALDRDLHAGALEAAGADAGLRAVLSVVQAGRHHRD